MNLLSISQWCVFCSCLAMITIASATQPISYETKAEWRLSASDIGIITTVAGTGVPNYNGDDIPATQANLQFPEYVAVDTFGNVYIADTLNNRVRKVTKATGIITTIAGTGQAGYNGDNMAATSALLNSPSAVAIDSIGDVYIADTLNSRLRVVSEKTGIITTVAGTGVASFSGDNMQSTLSAIYHPYGVAIDSSRNIYITDSGNFRIRKVNITTGIITTFAGNGINGFTGDNVLASTTSLSFGSGICFDPVGNLFIADYQNHRIRMVDKNTGIITTVAGTGTNGFDGDFRLATSAYLNYPADIAVDTLGNLYIADAFNYRVRMVTKSTGIITTIAGTGIIGKNIDGMLATAADLSLSYSVALTLQGDLYIADEGNSKVQHVKLWNPTAMPSSAPSSMPSAVPTSLPSAEPSSMPSAAPSSMPSAVPSSMPSAVPSSMPSPAPSPTPSAAPSPMPSPAPSPMPSAVPTSMPSAVPTSMPSAAPSSMPSAVPSSMSSAEPSSMPSAVPTSMPSAAPTSMPSAVPTSMPSAAPSSMPSAELSSMPSAAPSSMPRAVPSSMPSAEPSSMPSAAPISSRPHVVPFPLPVEPTTFFSKRPHCEFEDEKKKSKVIFYPSKRPTNKPTSRSTKKKSSPKY